MTLRATDAATAIVLLLAASVAAAQTNPLVLSCARPAPASDVALRLPARVTVDDAAPGTVLVIEERDVDIEATSGAQTIDLPPARLAFETVSVAAPRAEVALRARSKGIATGTFRLHLYCNGDTAGLAELAQAGAKLATSEDAGLPRAVRESARADALAHLDRAAANAPSPPWLMAQVLHTRGFLLSRRGNVDASYTAYRDAAAAWRTIDDTTRAQWADIGAARQQRRRGEANAAEAAFATIAASALDPTLKRQAANDRCVTLRDLGSTDAAATCYRDAVALHHAAGDTSEEANSLANLADLNLGLARYARARQDADAAIALARRAGNARVELIAAIVSGKLLRSEGRLGESLYALTQSRALAERVDDANLAANLLRQLGVGALLLADTERARTYLTEAAERYRAGGFKPRAALTLVDLGTLERQAGHGDKAEAAIREAIALLDPIETASILADAQGLAAELALDRNDVAAAADALASARHAARKQGFYASAQRLDLIAARIALARGDAAAARDAGAQVAHRAAQARDPLFAIEAGEIEADAADAARDPTRALAAYRDVIRRMLIVAQLQSYPLHRAHYVSRARRALERGLMLSLALRGDGEAARRERYAWAEELRASAALGAMPAVAGADPAERRAALAALNDAVRRHWQILAPEEQQAEPVAIADLLTRVERGVASDTAGNDAASLDASRWPRDTALLALLVGQTHTFAWRLDATGLVERHTANAAQAAKLAGELGELLPHTASPPQRIQELARALRDAIGLDDTVAGGAQNWYVVLDGPLSATPPILLVERPPADATWPAIVALGSSRQAARAQSDCCRNHPLYAFADPTPPSGAAAATVRAGGLARLPGSRAEAASIARLWRPAPQEVHVGAAFTKERALSALGRPGAIVHFATHGLTSRDTPGLSALLIASETGGRGLDVLTWHDIVAAGVKADLVVLGACDAAGGARIDAAGTVGLTQAILAAGAPDVIAPLWQVADRDSVAFMEEIYRALADGATPAAAVARAQRRSVGSERYNHPALWAGFVAFAARVP
jgi:hypothetical protein